MAKTRERALAIRHLFPMPNAAAASAEQSIFVRSQHALYDQALCQLALQAARAGDFQATFGIYLATLGPTYETRAEYRMMRILGADVVGMSTAPEVQMASSLAMRVLGLSVVSNVAQPDAIQNVSHHDVLAAAHHAADKLRKIIAATLRDS
jgi:purine-nucleoside phosphorylase